MTSSKWRGNKIEILGDIWIYSDTKQKVSEEKNRACGHCGRPQTKEGYDGCIGTLEGAMNACCGHGNIDEAYIQYSNNHRESGEKALKIIKENQHKQERW